MPAIIIDDESSAPFTHGVVVVVDDAQQEQQEEQQSRRGTIHRIEDCSDDDAEQPEQRPTKRPKTTNDAWETGRVGQVRQHVLNLLESKLGTQEAPATTQEGSHRLSTLESLLFATASSFDEYCDESTLDLRLKNILRALLERKLRKAEHAAACQASRRQQQQQQQLVR